MELNNSSVYLENLVNLSKAFPAFMYFVEEVKQIQKRYIYR